MTALSKYEKKRKTAVSSKAEKDWRDVLSLLDDIDNAADKTKAKCNPKLQKKTIGFLMQMKKQTSLEVKTANQMIAVAGVDKVLQNKVVENRKLVAVAKKFEKTPGQLMKILAPLAKNLPGWVKEKDAKNLSGALRTMTKVKGEVKKMAPVTDRNEGGSLDRNLGAVSGFKSVPKDFQAWVKEIKVGHAYCHKVAAEATRVSGEVNSLNTWLEKKLMALKK